MSSTFIRNSVEAPFSFHSGIIMRSPNKRYVVSLSRKGGFQISRQNSEKPRGVNIWSNSIEVEVKHMLTMNIDLTAEGNLGMYSDTNKKDLLWETKTGGKGITKMEITDDGSLHLLIASGAVLWKDGMMPQDMWTGPAENTLS